MRYPLYTCPLLSNLRMARDDRCVASRQGASIYDLSSEGEEALAYIDTLTLKYFVDKMESVSKLQKQCGRNMLKPLPLTTRQ